MCDKDGCDWNPFRLGDKDFFGPGANFTIDSTQPMTVVTQFITVDGTDTGDLKVGALSLMCPIFTAVALTFV